MQWSSETFKLTWSVIHVPFPSLDSVFSYFFSPTYLTWTQLNERDVKKLVLPSKCYSYTTHAQLDTVYRRYWLKLRHAVNHDVALRPSFTERTLLRMAIWAAHESSALEIVPTDIYTRRTDARELLKLLQPPTDHTATVRQPPTADQKPYSNRGQTRNVTEEDHCGKTDCYQVRIRTD